MTEQTKLKIEDRNRIAKVSQSTMKRKAVEKAENPPFKVINVKIKATKKVTFQPRQSVLWETKHG